MSKQIPAESIAHHIKTYREANSMTQETLANKLGVVMLTIRRWEHMKVKPNQLCYRELIRQGIIPEPTNQKKP